MRFRRQPSPAVRSHDMMAHRRAILPTLMFLSLAVALVYAAANTGWRPHRTPMAGRATIEPPAAAAVRASNIKLRMCVSPAGLCAAPPLRLGDPCSCPDLLRGLVPGRIELLDQPRGHRRDAARPPVDLFDWRAGAGP